MDVREATMKDANAVRTIARSSMEASYSLSPETIRSAVKNWYDDEGLEAKLDDPDLLLLVGETDEGIVAFSESAVLDGKGDVLWLHVDPMFRGEGLGEAMFEATREAMTARDVNTVRGLVLEDNREGNDFYEQLGFYHVGDRHVEIDGTEYLENIYAEEEPAEVVTTTNQEGDRLYVDRNDSDRGSKGPFYVVYSDEEQERLYGYSCGNCDTLVVSMDSMGKMECDACGNVRKPTRWDATYM
jgi:ribosomal protein S18 acetylase RimI-like enzyme